MTTRKQHLIMHAHLSVANRLKMARKQAGFPSQADFATVLGVSRGLVGQWESGRKMPGRTNLLLLAKHCGIAVEWLVGESADMKMSVASANDREARVLLAFRRLTPLGQQRYEELLTEGIKIRRSVQQETEPS